VPTPLLIVIKALNGGVFVALFAVLGEMTQPKRFAGIFGASPAVALANLIVIGLAQGNAAARGSAIGMIAGTIALAVACAATIAAVRRWGAVRGSALMWGVWMAVGAAIAVPVAAGTGARSAAGLLAGRLGRHGHGGGGGRLFTVDFRALRDIRPGELAVRFAFGAAISVVAGLVGVAAGKRAGGVLLAAPAVLSAALTIIEKREGRGAAVAEVQGSVPGAVALIGFAAVAAALTAKLPLAVALLSALATWVAAAIGGYLVQSAALAARRRDVRHLARQRRDADRARRGS
jgi:hypothetical protein